MFKCTVCGHTFEDDALLTCPDCGNVFEQTGSEPTVEEKAEDIVLEVQDVVHQTSARDKSEVDPKDNG